MAQPQVNQGFMAAVPTIDFSQVMNNANAMIKQNQDWAADYYARKEEDPVERFLGMSGKKKLTTLASAYLTGKAAEDEKDRASARARKDENDKNIDLAKVELDKTLAATGQTQLERQQRALNIVNYSRDKVDMALRLAELNAVQGMNRDDVISTARNYSELFKDMDQEQISQWVTDTFKPSEQTAGAMRRFFPEVKGASQALENRYALELSAKGIRNDTDGNVNKANANVNGIATTAKELKPVDLNDPRLELSYDKQHRYNLALEEQKNKYRKDELAIQYRNAETLAIANATRDDARQNRADDRADARAEYSAGMQMRTTMVAQGYPPPEEYLPPEKPLTPEERLEQTRQQAIASVPTLVQTIASLENTAKGNPTPAQMKEIENKREELMRARTLAGTTPEMAHSKRQDSLLFQVDNDTRSTMELKASIKATEDLITKTTDPNQKRVLESQLNPLRMELTTLNQRLGRNTEELKTAYGVESGRVNPSNPNMRFFGFDGVKKLNTLIQSKADPNALGEYITALNYQTVLTSIVKGIDNELGGSDGNDRVMLIEKRGGQFIPARDIKDGVTLIKPNEGGKVLEIAKNSNPTGDYQLIRPDQFKQMVLENEGTVANLKRAVEESASIRVVSADGKEVKRAVVVDGGLYDVRTGAPLSDLDWSVRTPTQGGGGQRGSMGRGKQVPIYNQKTGEQSRAIMGINGKLTFTDGTPVPEDWGLKPEAVSAGEKKTEEWIASMPTPNEEAQVDTMIDTYFSGKKIEHKFWFDSAVNTDELKIRMRGDVASTARELADRDRQSNKPLSPPTSYISKAIEGISRYVHKGEYHPERLYLGFPEPNKDAAITTYIQTDGKNEYASATNKDRFKERVRKSFEDGSLLVNETVVDGNKKYYFTGQVD